MTPALKRSLAFGAAWTGSAVAAVGLGFLAVSLVGASASPATQPVATGATASSGETSPTAPATVPAVTSGEQVTVGGTVYASCAGGVPDLAGAPAPGWRVDDSDDPGEVEFENGTQKVEVRTVCAGAAPQFSVEGPRADESGGPGSSSSSGSPSRSTSGGEDSGGDDSSGRGSGGGGSDDSVGDGSSGRGGGGGDSDD